MAYYPTSATGLNYVTLPAGPTPDGTTVTASGSTNTKGSYAQVTASTAFASNWAIVTCLRTDATAGLQYLLDVSTGAAASEVVKIPDIMLEGTTSATSLGGMSVLSIPYGVASATRVAMRVACSTGSKTAVVALTFIAAGGFSGVTAWTNYGSNSADSGGTSIDPGAAANTKGSYVQLTASTSAVIQTLAAVYSDGGNGGPTTVSGAEWLMDVATGAGGAEVVLIPDLVHLQSIGSQLAFIFPPSHYVLTYIAASTRIACRASCGITDASDRLFDVVLITGTAPSESAGSGGSYAFA